MAYRSIFTTKETNNLRLMWWTESVDRAMKNLEESMVVLRLLRLTFGDQCGAAFLELCLRTIIAPNCKTLLGRFILENARYVDDGLKAHHDKRELHEAMEDIIQTLRLFGFEVKHVCTEFLSWHLEKGQLNPDFSTEDGTFTAGQEGEVVFHHLYGYQDDSLGINIDLNLFNKVR